MPLSDQLATAIMQHAPLELAANNTYLMFALQFRAKGFFGCEAFFAKQSLEEREHLTKFLSYLNDFRKPYFIPSCPQIVAQIETDPYTLFCAALAMEQDVTASITRLCEIARGAHDEQGFTFLQWFIAEQTKSEVEYQDIIARLEMDLNNPAVFDEWVKELT